jgi:hypothetical protein
LYDIVVTVFGIIVLQQPLISVFVAVLIIALQLSLESNTAFSGATLMDDKRSQLENLQLIMCQLVLIKTVEK